MTPSSMSLDYNAYNYGRVAACPPSVTYDGRSPQPLSSIAVMSNYNDGISHVVLLISSNQASGVHSDESVVRIFLKEACVVSNNELSIYMSENRAFVRCWLRR